MSSSLKKHFLNINILKYFFTLFGTPSQTQYGMLIGEKKFFFLI